MYYIIRFVLFCGSERLLLLSHGGCFPLSLSDPLGVIIFTCALPPVIRRWNCIRIESNRTHINLLILLFFAYGPHTRRDVYFWIPHHPPPPRPTPLLLFPSQNYLLNYSLSPRPDSGLLIRNYNWVTVATYNKNDYCGNIPRLAEWRHNSPNLISFEW